MKKIFRSSLIILSLASLLMSGVVQAADYNLEEAEGTGVLPWYQPNALMCATESSSIGTMSGTNNLEKIWNYLLSKGLTDNQAAGVLGNIEAESGTFSPFRQEAGIAWLSGGYGLVQWTGDRRRALEAEFQSQLPSDIYSSYYQEEYGGATTEENGYVPEGISVEINDRFLQVELDFLYSEVTTRTVIGGHGWSGTEWDALKATSTVQEASDLWLYSFERPLSPNSADRAQKGQAILEKLQSSSADSSSTSNSISGDTASQCGTLLGSVSGSGFGSGELQSLLLGYAWPTYTAGKTEKTPGYASAIAAAQADGQYIGGCDGVDCGAFVTRLVIDSGWDVNYNSSGKGGNTDSQESWAKTNWETLGNGASIDTATLQPGDVAFQPGHTFIFVGNVEGFESNIASSSLCDRAPMAGKESITDSSVTWYRRK